VLDPRGDARARLEIELTNTAPTAGLAPYAAGVLSPAERPGRNLTYVSVYAGSRAAMLDFHAGTARTAESAHELGHPVFSWFQRVPPQARRAATLTLETPAAARRRGALWTYRLDLQSQPMLNPPAFDLELRLPAGASVRSARGPGASLNGRTASFRTVLDRDRSIAVAYCLCQGPRKDS
jgi:hypothetical protein